MCVGGVGRSICHVSRPQCVDGHAGDVLASAGMPQSAIVTACRREKPQYEVAKDGKLGSGDSIRDASFTRTGSNLKDSVASKTNRNTEVGAG